MSPPESTYHYLGRVQRRPSRFVEVILEETPGRAARVVLTIHDQAAKPAILMTLVADELAPIHGLVNRFLQGQAS